MEPIVIPNDSLATASGGLSQGVADAACAAASERFVDLNNFAPFNPLTAKRGRQMARFCSYKGS